MTSKKHKTRPCRVKTSNNEDKHKKVNLLPYVIGATVLILIAILISGRSDGKDYNDFALCLSENDAVMYGMYWCSHCKAQKAEFGESFKYINYVECTEQNDVCISKGIEGFPTWIIDDKRYPGKQSMERLAALTGCELPE